MEWLATLAKTFGDPTLNAEIPNLIFLGKWAMGLMSGVCLIETIKADNIMDLIHGATFFIGVSFSLFCILVT